MKLYYLVPFETDENKKICPGMQPKYLNLIMGHDAIGLISKITEKEGSITKKCKVPFYIIAMDLENENDMNQLANKPDVLKLHEGLTLNDFGKLGVVIPNFNDLDLKAEKEKKIIKWLIDEERDFDGVIKIGK
jgi:hypothetical protein